MVFVERLGGRSDVLATKGNTKQNADQHKGQANEHRCKKHRRSNGHRLTVPLVFSREYLQPCVGRATQWASPAAGSYSWGCRNRARSALRLIRKTDQQDDSPALRYQTRQAQRFVLNSRSKVLASGGREPTKRSNIAQLMLVSACQIGNQVRFNTGLASSESG